MESQRGLVLDANILVRLVLGRRVRELVLEHADRVAFFTPRVCYADARKYLPGLLTARNIDPASALAVLERFESIVRVLDESVFVAMRAQALARIESRDADDWPVLAAALALGLPLWTEDRDFFGTGIPTWTTDRVALYLNATEIE